MYNISDINAVNVYESWYHGNFSTIAPMFDKFISYIIEDLYYWVYDILETHNGV